MKIAFIGYGKVGAPLADHLQRLGHQVTLAASDASSEGVKKARARNANLEVAPINQAVTAADVVFLATPFQANEGVLKAVGDALNGKILVDCTNPVGPGLTHGLKNVQLVATFDAASTGFKPEDFAGKLLGRNRRGELLFGYVRMPGHQGLTPLVSQRAAKLEKLEALTVMVENFGLVASQPSPMKTTVRNAAGKEQTVDSTIPALASYAGHTVNVRLPAAFLEPGTKGSVKTVITPVGSRPIEVTSSVEVPK